MNKLRQSLRRKKQPYVPEASRPHQWQSDEETVRKGKCSFPVRYLGHMEVEESRGMHVCEEAVKKLKTAGKKTVKAILWVSADGLRVVDDKTKDLIVDQTIEKVSFCAPDRNYDKAFSYICRDGTTRRWICHCFMALKDSGERLSHAVGCAFAACLERKQRREKECGVTASFDASRTSFTREGSFRLTASQPVDREESGKHPHDKKKAESTVEGSPASGPAAPTPGSASPPRGEGSPVDRSEPGSQHAIPRRHAPLEQLVRQGSFRGFPALSQKNSPFKRQLSLRLNELPSTLQRKTAEFEVKSPVPEFDASPTAEPGLHRPHADPFTTTPPTGSNTTIPTLPPPHPAHGSGGWAEVTTFHPSHRRTPSEAERWLREAAKAAQTHQPGLPAPAAPQPTHAHTLLPGPPVPQPTHAHTLLPAHVHSIPSHTPSFPLLADTAPSSLFGPSVAYLPTYPTTSLSNGLTYPPARVPIVGITPSQMVVNAFGSAHASHSPHLPPAFGLPSSPALSLHPSPLPPPPRSNGLATAARPSLPPPHPPDNDHFEAQWAALETKGQQRAASVTSNPFNSDLHKTFEIQL